MGGGDGGAMVGISVVAVKSDRSIRVTFAAVQVIASR